MQGRMHERCEPISEDGYQRMWREDGNLASCLAVSRSVSVKGQKQLSALPGQYNIMAILKDSPISKLSAGALKVIFCLFRSMRAPCRALSIVWGTLGLDQVTYPFPPVKRFRSRP